MKREIITTDSYSRITIPSDTGNIWMNEMELVELFGVIAPTLRAAIRAVYKCGVLKAHVQNPVFEKLKKLSYLS